MDILTLAKLQTSTNQNSRPKATTGEREQNYGKDKNTRGTGRECKNQKEKKTKQKIVRVVKKVPITFYSCNASHIMNKMLIIGHNVWKHKFDVIRMSEAGLLKKDPTGMTGYKSVKLARKEPNRGWVIWVRADLMDRMVRVYAQNKEDTGSEIIQLQMDTIPRQTFSGCTKKQENQMKKKNTLIRD